jgi:hypothetical protein
MGSDAAGGGDSGAAAPPQGDPEERKEALDALLRTPMVSWYSPFELAKSATDIAVSALLGPRGDFRLIEALGEDQDHFDYSTGEGGAARASMWIDYVADAGDGFNPTFTIASLLSRQELVVGGRRTLRGEVLVMGGDQVYPSASREAYQLRLVRPYECARRPSRRGEVIADLFAIPGNHDWYDGLTAFMRLFGQRRTLAGWQTRQSRSYFALKLPHGFWLLGVDIQLNADMDTPQIQYFCRIAEQHMRPGDRLILCTAEPDWVVGKIYDPRLQDNLAYLERLLLEKQPGARVAARIAGDLHHYRRHTSDLGEHNLIAGGGGAFLHPTHGEPVDEVRSGPRGAESTYRLQASFPTEAQSRRLAWRNLGFHRDNPAFAVVAAAAYALLSLAVLRLGIASVVGVVLFLGFVVLYTDTSRLRYRLAGGLAHGVAHLSAALAATWGLVRALGLDQYPRGIASSCDGAPCFRLEQAPLPLEIAALAGAGAAGALLGPLVLGLYLLVSLNGFRRHGNEAFSSLRIQDYKNFLRMHVEPDRLTIYPIGVERVPRRWRSDPGAGPGEPLIVPAEGEIAPHLIEEPIVIGGADGGADRGSPAP